MCRQNLLRERCDFISHFTTPLNTSNREKDIDMIDALLYVYKGEAHLGDYDLPEVSLHTSPNHLLYNLFRIEPELSSSTKYATGEFIPIKIPVIAKKDEISI